MTGRRRSFPAQAVVAIALLTVVLATSAPAASARTDTPASTPRADRFRTWMLVLINEMRAGRNLPELGLNQRLSGESWWHSRSMARRVELFHTPNLASVIAPYGATLWGENVGVARTLRRILELMMASAPHRAYLVDPRLRWIGIGVVRRDGWAWVTLDLHD